jgi:hypothetical protein
VNAAGGVPAGGNSARHRAAKAQRI